MRGKDRGGWSEFDGKRIVNWWSAAEAGLQSSDRFANREVFRIEADAEILKTS